jgi:hypothetical protein
MYPQIYGSDVRLAIENLERSTLNLPTDPPANATKTKTRIWEKEVDKFVRKKAYLKENLKTLSSLLVWGQCTDNIIWARIKALDRYDVMSNEGDLIGPLKAIKALIYKVQSQKYWPLVVHDGTCQFYLLYQDKHMPWQAYLEKFQNAIDVLEHCGGSIGQVPGLMNIWCWKLPVLIPML